MRTGRISGDRGRKRGRKREHTRWMGNQGEDLAADYLRSLGFEILERNYRTKLGELDIVALDGETIVFVEVKRRREAISGLEAVDIAKQRRLARLALEYLCCRKARCAGVRFDVVAVVALEGSDPAYVHVKDAFDAIFEY